MSFLKNKATLVIASTCIAYLFSGCAKAPDAQYSAAKAAIEAAKTAEADKYMAKNFQNLQAALAKADAELAKQQQAFILTRKYKRVTEMLEKTTALATEIATEAPKIKADIVGQVKENLGLAKGMLKETAEDIKKASRKTDKAVITELKSYLSEADSIAAVATNDFNTGNVLKAAEELTAFQGLIKKITDTLKPKTEE